MKQFTIYYSTQKGVTGALPLYAYNEQNAIEMFEEQYTKWTVVKVIKAW
ncbi:MAG: hypothetical protein ACOVQ4_13105 [Flectobacillus sp.]